jgi:hypothetical protein
MHLVVVAHQQAEALPNLRSRGVNFLAILKIISWTNSAINFECDRNHEIYNAS